MQAEQRTAGEWFELWDQLAGERREIGDQRSAAFSVDDMSEYERLSRAYDVAEARAHIAYIRFLMVKYNISTSEILDLTV